jgi:hypothetical protein
MVITILAEPRSGSTNLTNWFYFQKNIDVLFEPLNPVSEWFQNGINPSNYKRVKDILCIKEIYYPHKEWEDLITISNKIIVLYRENVTEQLESFINSVTTNNWSNNYVYKNIDNNFTKEKTQYFNQLKSEFNQKYVNNPNYFKISYEELYYHNGFQKILDYLNINDLENKNFPYGKKYRIDIDKKNKTLI